MNRIGDLVEATETVNPRSAPDREFDYIDVSSTSSERLEVVATQRLRGKDAPSRARRKVRHGDVIFATVRPTLQRLALIPPELDQSVCSTGYIVLRPKAELNQRYLFYSLLRTQFMKEMERLQKGASYPAVTDGDVRAQLIPVPPLSGQKRIVAILDEAFTGIDAAVANAEKNLTAARELFHSHLHAFFSTQGEGWTTKAVKDLAEHSLGKMLDKRKNRGEPQPYLRNLNVRWFDFDLRDMLEMKFEEHEVDRYSIRRGDVVVCEGGYPGRAAIWDEDESVFFQKALHRVRFHDVSHRRWFMYFLYLSDVTGDLHNHFTGAGIQHFTGKALSRFPVPIAPSPVLEQSVERFDSLHNQVRELEGVYRRKLAALSELRQSILQKAFAGELAAKEADREMAAA